MINMNCIDCIHYEPCKDWAQGYYYGVDNPFPYECEQDEKPCDHYKNKSDVVEVIHGKWVWKDFNGDGFETLCCSECLNTEGARFTAQYCVECGAKMMNTK